MLSKDWLHALGFSVVLAPGISRAWRAELRDGRYILITDIGGFDLPDPKDPFSAACLSMQDELLEFAPLLSSTTDLLKFMHSATLPAEK